MSAASGKLVCMLDFALPAIFVLLGLARPFFAQTTVGTGSIVGTVSDPSGAVVPGAEITITNAATGQVTKLSTNASGVFSSGAAVPGDYNIQMSAKGFNSAEVPVTVLVGNSATVNVSLLVGPAEYSCRGARLHPAGQHRTAHRPRRVR
jgi:hypothetical protein